MNRNHNSKLFILALTVFLAVAHVPQGLAVTDKTIKQRIEEAAANTTILREAKVGVVVEHGYVILYGTVRLYSQKMAYERIAWQTMGVVEVDDEIRVVPVLPLTDTAIKRKIREIVKTYERFRGAQVDIRVEDGSVFLRATLDHPGDILFLKHRVAEIEGVVAMEIDAAFRV